MSDLPGSNLPPPRTPTFGPEDLRRMFVRLAGEQAGDKYRFGAEARDGDADPTAFDSSELVEWAAHRAGAKDMPDGSWNQYRFLHEKGGATSLEEALHTKGALVFGFSSDPLASPDRPARAYVAISMGDGQNVIDVSERGGEVRVMPHGGFYGYGAKIPQFHHPDEMIPPPVAVDTNGDGILDSSLAPGAPRPSLLDNDAAFHRQPYPREKGVTMDRRTTEPGPAGEWIYPDPVAPVRPSGPVEQPGLVSEPDAPLTDDPVRYPVDDLGPSTQADPVAPGPDGPAYADSPAYADDPAYGDGPAYADSLAYADVPATDGPTYIGGPTPAPGPAVADASAYGPADLGGGAADADPFADSYTDLSADV